MGDPERRGPAVRIAVVAARNEADRLAATIAALREASPGITVFVACEAALDGARSTDLVLLCDGDLEASAAELLPLLEAVESNDCDLAIASFARRLGGGVGATKGFARWAIRSLSGYQAGEPISGQRAMRASTLRSLMPFAAAYGMETAMTIDAVRAGHRVSEIELDLNHRATGRTLRGFLHRGRQLRDIAAVYVARRRG
jgi:hypothetical protein